MKVMIFFLREGIVFPVSPANLRELKLSLPAFYKLADHFAQLTGNVG